jgi:hypothetical protein
MLRKILAASLCISLVAPAVLAAPKKRGDPILLAAQNQSLATDYAINIWMPQTWIEASYDLGRVPSSQAGGLLDGLIIGSMDRNRKDILSLNLQEKADRQIQPIRTALRDFDVESLAVTTTEKALSVPDWFKNKPTVLAKNLVPEKQTKQTALISYRYEMSPDFSSIRLFADISLSRDTAQKKSKSAAASGPIFSHVITSIVQLRKRAFEPGDNAAQWSAEQGKLAKEGLSAAFARMEDLIPTALKMTSANLKAYNSKNHEQGYAAGFNGPLLKRGGRAPDDILIWSKGLLQVHTLP